MPSRTELGQTLETAELSNDEVILSIVAATSDSGIATVPEAQI
jgi:hypothetical protein